MAKKQTIIKRAFQGRRIAIIADADPVGLKHAQEVAASIAPVASSVKLLELSGVGVHDVSDWLEGPEATSDPKTELERLAARAEPLTATGTVPRFKIQYFGDPEREPEIQLPEPLVEDFLFPGYIVAHGKWKRSGRQASSSR